MTLPPWILRVKQARGEFLLALLTSLLVTAALLNLHDHDEVREADAHRFGSSLAAGLASLAVEPLDTRDRIHLGVLANRLTELSAVAGVTIYTVADEVLAVSGENQRGLPLTEPVVRDNNIIGYVRVTLVSPQGSTGSGEYWLAALFALLIPVFVLALRLVPWQQLRPVPVRPSPPAHEEAEESPAAAVSVPISCGILALNLFNQLTLKPEAREAELDMAAGIAEAVADLYAASVESLPGTGLLLTFEGAPEAERSFQFVCAAMLLARLLNRPDSAGQYRIGLHTVSLPANQTAPTDLIEIQDAALLSALARPLTVAISDALYHQVPRPERLQAEPMQNPLLHQLESTDPKAWLVTGLEEPHQTLIAAQARELDYSSEPATPNESTF